LAFNGVYPDGNVSWHHLWFLPYLLLFSLVLIPLFLQLKNRQNTILNSWLKQIAGRASGLYVFIVPLFFIEAFIEPFFPVTHALVGDWFAMINYITLFFFGFLLMTIKDTFWLTVEHSRRYLLAAGIIFFTLMLFISLRYEDSLTRHLIEAFLKVANLWSWILTLFGFAAKYLNKKSKALSYSNEAVYPFYILHQTVMIVIAYFLINLKWSLGLKAFVMIIGTFGISWLLFEFFIRRWKFLRPLFGLKNNEGQVKVSKLFL
jgi:glucan biosynthesis protein C